MKNLDREITANCRAFSESWPKEMVRVFKAIRARDSERILSQYRRIVSLQAWRAEMIEQSASVGVLGFFLEAQNDALVSMVLAQMGSCRAALQSLRSCVENVFYTLYYMDHPVELRLWESGQHKLGFSHLESYFASHPDFSDVSNDIQCLPTLSAEYATLSRAVHGSASGFRMSGKAVGTQLWTDDNAKMGKYDANQRTCLGAINQVLLCFFRHQLQGAAYLNLRKAVSFAIPKGKHGAIKSKLGISLLAPPPR